MERDVNSQLRITAWPPAPLPLPTASKVEYEFDSENGVLLPRSLSALAKPSSFESVALSGETYLRLNEVDLDDPMAILAFASEYGLLGGCDAYLRVIENVRPYLLKQMYEPALDYTLEREAKWRSLSQGDFTSLGRDAQNAALAFTETLNEFRFAARCIRDLTSAWNMFREGTDPKAMTWVSPSYIESLYVGNDDFPISLYFWVFPAFMRPFSPHLEFYWTDLPPDTRRFPPRTSSSRITVEPLRVTRQADLVEICALELFNHIIGNTEYRVCANDRCQRTFVHQHGRAQKGQRRSRGVLYCTPECARATAQREYRRRKRAAKS